MKDVVIVSACQSQIGKFGGSLKSLETPHLAAQVMSAAIEVVLR